MKKVFTIALLLLLILGTITPVMAKECENVIQLSEKDASIVGLAFVKSHIDSGMETKWNYNTRIYKTIPIYDLSDSVIGYTFYLRDEAGQGYITVSASSGDPLIKEFSDEGNPAYEKVFNEDTDIVINTGGIDYYVKKKGDVLTRIDGEAVSEKEIITHYKPVETHQSLNYDILKDIFGKQYVQEISSKGNTAGTAITNPVTYLQNVYGNGWTNHSYSNSMEGKLSGHFTGNTANDCVMVASSTILEYYKKYRGKSSLGTYSGIYNTGLQVLSENPSYYTPASGIGVTYISAYVRKVLQKYGYSWTVSSLYNMSISSMKAEITNERPILVNVGTLNHFYYNHAIAAYAWTRFNGPSSLGGYVTFLKIYDGWSSTPRYVDVNSLGSLYTATKIVP